MNPRHALALAAVLAATVLTGGAAILGIASTPAHVSGVAGAAVAQTAPLASPSWEGAD